MSNRYLHKHKWIAVLLCLCFMMSFILPGYAMDGGVDAGGSDVSVSDGGSSGDSGSGDIGSGDATGGGESGSGDTGSGDTGSGSGESSGDVTGGGESGGSDITGGGTEGGEQTPGTGEGTEGGEPTNPDNGEGTVPPTEGGDNTGEVTPPVEEGTNPPVEGETTPPVEEEKPLPPAECNCGTTTGVHSAECAVYAGEVCYICGAAVGSHHKALEDGTMCPFFPHMVGCEGAGCTIEGCACECHQPVSKLYERLIACTTIEEIDEVFDSVELWEIALMSEEEMAEVEALIESLEPEPLPPVFIESEPPVPSEIIIPGEEIVNVTDVAPFKDPVAGPIPMRPMRPMFGVPAPQEDNGLELSKTATVNGDGTYRIQLEAYATGSKVITEGKKDVPTDIVLVLDQSGSMDDDFGEITEDQFVSYGKRTNEANYNNSNNNGDNNLWYKLDDGSYVSVSVTVTNDSISYIDITNGRNNSTNYGRTSYWNNRDNLYTNEKTGHQKVVVTRTSSDGTYSYRLLNGTLIVESNGRTGNPDFGDYGPLCLPRVDTSKNVYSYTYTDASGVTHEIGTASTGADTVFETAFYEKIAAGSNITRKEALTNALNAFVSDVNTKAAGKDGILGTEDDINHRVAMVGFASGDRWNGNSYNYGNTEVFIGADQYRYGTSAQGVYASAFQSMNTTGGQANVAASIGALDANGGTLTNLGLEMANGILDANPVASGEQRNRVVIVFTDGQPGWSGYDSNVANNAIASAKTSKDDGTTVYTVGVFDGANASSAGNANGNNTEKSNWFMQNMSSNNGTVQTPSYYLSAADADTLNNIFQQIADNIESGGSATTLNEEAVIKDIISNQFELPAGTSAANIALETYACTGEDANGVKTWAPNGTTMGASATVSGSNVDVTGFDFSENWCGTETKNGVETYRGNKLVITFNVKAKDVFLGGNNVYTNDAASGIYANEDAEEVFEAFDRPQVNVPTRPVTVTAEDKNVYLLGTLTGEELKTGAVAKVGEETVDFSQPNNNYGLSEDTKWKVEYVDITMVVKNTQGEILTLEKLKDDQKYTVEVIVSPKNDGTGAEGTPAGNSPASVEKNINVFLPTLTFKDSTVYYGESGITNPDYFNTNNRVDGITWTHGDTDSTAVTMIGTAPAATDFGFTYTPDTDKISADNKINTKEDFYVNVATKLFAQDLEDKYIKFAHRPCNLVCSFDSSKGEFMLHPKTCQLTITKTGGAAGEPYVFDVYKDGAKYSEVTIVGNTSETIYELPVGIYTIEEATDWSWRYNPSYDGSVTLSKDVTSGTITCTNTNNNNKWLNGYSDVMTNIYNVITGN